jgi:GTP-binding protein Era
MFTPPQNFADCFPAISCRASSRGSNASDGKSKESSLAHLPVLMISSLAENAGEVFLDFILPFVPEGPLYYPADEMTDASLRFFASEYVRKQIIDLTHEEVPHAV